MSGEGAGKKVRPIQRRKRYYYALRFSYICEFENDTVYFAFARPFTYYDIYRQFLLHEHKLKREEEPSGISEGADSSLLSPGMVPDSGSRTSTLGKPPRAGEPPKNSRNALNLPGEKKEEEETPPWESESGADEDRKNERTTIRTSKLIYVRRKICRTIAGLPVEEIVITGPPLPSFKSTVIS